MNIFDAAAENARQTGERSYRQAIEEKGGSLGPYTSGSPRIDTPEYQAMADANLDAASGAGASYAAPVDPPAAPIVVRQDSDNTGCWIIGSMVLLVVILLAAYWGYL